MRFLPPKNPCVLIVDDEEDVRSQIAGVLKDEDYEVLEAKNSKEALRSLEDNKPHLVILDIWLNHSDYDGLQILKLMKRVMPNIPVVMISGHSTVDIAVSSLKQGAFQFLTKPFKTESLLFTVKQALSYTFLQWENAFLKEHAEYSTMAASSYEGCSLDAKNMRSFIQKVSKTESRILIEGEIGTGKTHTAYLIHDQSSRASWPIVSIDCRNLTEDNYEEVFVGKGENDGCLQKTNYGTLLIKNVSYLPDSLQKKLAQAIHRKVFKKSDLDQEIKIKSRLIFTSSFSLDNLVKEGDFCEDLYTIINMSKIKITPLRERLEDVPYLLTRCLSRYRGGDSNKEISLSKECIEVLKKGDWNANMYDVVYLARRMFFYATIKGMRFEEFTDKDLISLFYNRYSLEKEEASSKKPPISLFMDQEVVLKKARELFEKEFIIYSLKKNGNSITKTAKVLELDRASLHRKMKSYDIKL